LRAREALGQCFLDRGSPELAAATLERAVAERGSGDAGEESRLLGVLYLLGEAHARLGRVAPARACFERVVASDIEFRDAVTRLTQLSASSP
jgi:tetratricopeptide (TPR) repeat protein